MGVRGWGLGISEPSKKHPMKITRIDVWKVVVPTRPGTVNDPEFPDEVLDTFGRAPKHIIRVRTDEDIEGIGETTRFTQREHVDAAVAALIGKDPTKFDLAAMPHPRNRAYDAFEMAMLDILGKILGTPVCRLLGGMVRDRVRCDYWTGMRTPKNLARCAAEGQRRGWQGIKIKCRLEQPNVERLRAVAKACGTEFKVTVDPNERFHTPAQAIDLAWRLQEIGNVEVFEDPTPKQGRIDDYVHMRAKMPIPLAMHLGEPQFLWNALRAGAIDYLNCSPGSAAQWMEMVHLAQNAGVPCWHGSGVDLGVMEHMFLHRCAAAPNATLASDIFGELVRENDLIRDPILFKNGHALVPQRPGLGCELDMKALAQYAVK